MLIKNLANINIGVFIGKFFSYNRLELYNIIFEFNIFFTFLKYFFGNIKDKV